MKTCENDAILAPCEPLDKNFTSLHDSEQYQRQLALEEEMLLRGRDRYFTNISRMKDRAAEANTSYGKVLLKRGIEPLAERITRFISESKSGGAGRRHKAVALLDGMDTHVVAFITLRKVLDTFSIAMSYQKIATLVAREVELEVKLAELEAQDPDRYKMTQRHIQGSKARKYRRTVLQYAFGKSTTVEFLPWPETDCLHLGQKLIELAIESTGLFRLTMTNAVKTKVKGKMYQQTQYTLEPTPSCREWVEQHKETASMLAPDYLPTIIPPCPWEGAAGGGYYSDALPRLSLVKTRNLDYLRMLGAHVEAGGMPDVLRSVNAMQDTAWAVNNTVLSVARHLWDNTDGNVAGLPPRDGHRLPLCPTCGADITDSAAARERHACLDALPLEEFNAWKKEAFRIRELNVSAFSQRLGVAKTLTMADRFKDEPRFYYPYQLDFRGRIYAVPSYLTPQGTDLAKGLLHFSAAKPLGTMQAVRWLAIHGSNCYGNDKVSLDDRHSWVLQHQEQILACAEDPYNNIWWQDADSPFCFLAFCMEWAGYVREGLSFASSLPIAMDGTCNGLQIFSLILRDEVGGYAVNLTPTELPQDIYRIVADKVVLKLQAEKDDEEKLTKTGQHFYTPTVAAKFLLTLGISRKTTKRQVMVLPYGGTRDSCREYTEDWLKGFIIPDRFNRRGLASYLSNLIWEAIGETVIKAREAMAYLQGVAGALNKANLPVRWTSPCGLPVLQLYRDMNSRQIKTRIGDKVIRPVLQEENPKSLNKPKQQSAISPNYVHSLDAAALQRTVCACLDTGITNFAMIHDSYGTHSADSEKLARTLRGTFIDMFGGDLSLLELFSREALASVPMDLLAKAKLSVPAMGTLNIQEVEKSLFFFA